MPLDIKSIPKASLFYMLVIGIGVGSLVIFILIGVFSFFELGAITFEGEISIGDDGFLGTLLVWPIFAILWIILSWLFCVIGFCLFGKARPVIIKVNETSDK